MSSVSVTTVENSVTITDAETTVVVTTNGGESVSISTGDITLATFQALEARVAALEALNLFLLEG